MNKQGQSALEFLMTYGWAILVVLIAIGALAYFGVLSPAKFLPESCVLFSGLGCNSFKVTPTTFTVIVQNGLGFTISEFNITVSGSGANCDGSSTDLDQTITDGAAKRTNFTCAGSNVLGVVGDRFKANLNISYAEGTGSNKIYHTKQGQIVSKIE